MMDRHDLAVILTTAMPPAPFEPAPEPAKTIRQAIKNLDRQTDLLLIETRLCHPIHETLQELAERIGK